MKRVFLLLMLAVLVSVVTSASILDFKDSLADNMPEPDLNSILTTGLADAHHKELESSADIALNGKFAAKLANSPAEEPVIFTSLNASFNAPADADHALNGQFAAQLADEKETPEIVRPEPTIFTGLDKIFDDPAEVRFKNKQGRKGKANWTVRSDGLVDAVLELREVKASIRGMPEKILEAVTDTVFDRTITTPIFAADDVSVETAEITLPKYGPVTAIMRCDAFDVENVSCKGTWNPSWLPFVDNGTHIIFNVTGFSGYGGGNITIINVQSYPTVGGNWEVNFNTAGVADLLITATNMTTWSDNDELHDLKFLSVGCDGATFAYEWVNDSVFIEDYTCNATGTETSKVITTGKHHLAFTYGNMTVYAHNFASGIGTLSQIYDTTFGQDGDTSAIAMSMSNETILDSPYNHTEVANLTFNEDGLFKVSYGVTWTSEGAGARHIMRNWVQRNGNEDVIPSETRCYIRNSAVDGRTCSNAGVLLVNASAGDFINLMGTKDHGSAGATVTSSDVWLYAQRVEREVAQTYDSTGGDDMNNVSLIVSTNTSTYIDTGTFTHVGNATRVEADGLYKIYYTVNHHRTDPDTNSDRSIIKVHLLENGTTNVTPSDTFSYIRDEADGDQNHNTGYVILNLAAGATIEVVALVELEIDDREHTTMQNLSWMLLERLGSNDVLQIREVGGNQSVIDGGFDAISFDTNDFIGESFHRPDEFNITFNNSGWYEVSYTMGWDDNDAGGRHIVSTVMRLNGQTIVQPSNQSDYTRGTSDATGSGRYQTNAANFLINVSAGDSLEMFMATIGGDADTEPNANWISIIPAVASVPILNTSVLTPIIGITQKVVQNDTFDFNVTIRCDGSSGSCGYTSVALRYNATGIDPDTNVSTLFNATPLYIVQSVRSNDVVVALQSTTNELRIYKFNNGQWEETTNVSDQPGGIEALEVGDADNDGLNEIVVGVDSDNQAKIFDYNVADGTWTETDISGNYAWHIEDIAIGDADNDGLNEVVIGLERTSTGQPTTGVTPVRMLKLVGGTWTETNITENAETNAVQWVEIGDVDGVPGNEVVALYANVTSDSGHMSKVELYKNSTSPWIRVNVTELMGGADARAERLDIGDVDNDGADEIVASTWNDVSAAPIFRMFIAENLTGPDWAQINITIDNGLIDGIDIGDVNMDGRIDIAVTNDLVVSGAGPNYVAVYENISGFTMTNVSGTSSGLGRDANIGDANNDGLIDLIAAQDQPLNLYENVTGAQINTTIQTFSVDIDSADVADPDNDNRLNNLTCGILLVGESCQLNYTLRATGNIGTFWAIDINITTNSTDTGSNDSDNAVIQIVGREFANISLSKADTPDPVNTSSNLSYVINVTSTGSATAFNVTLNETYPAQTIFLTSQPTPAAGTNNSFELGDLTAGTLVEVNITLFVTNVSNNTILNNTINTTFQNETANFFSRFVTESTTVELLIESMNITTNSTNTSAPIGFNATYLITIGNNGTHENTYNITVQNLDGVGVAEINQSEVTLIAGERTVVLHTVRNLVPGVFNTTITVVDSNNFELNESTLRMETTFIDVTAPNVTTLSPSGVTFNTTGILVNISALVIDEVQVDVVLANVTLPNLTTRVITLTDSDSDSVYNGTLTETNLFGRYDFRIIANDTSNNLNDTIAAFFFIARDMRLDVDADLDQYGQGSNAVITINATNTTGTTVANVTTVTDIIYGNGSTPFNAPWFDPGLTYRIPLNITEQSGNNLLGYVLNFTVDTSTMITDGELQGDCDDIRFAQFLDNLTVELNYSMMKHTCNTTSTLFFVGVPSVPASGGRRIYLYHDNTSVSAGSNDSAFLISSNVTKYVLSNALAVDNISIASYVDGNEIRADGTLIGVANRSQGFFIGFGQYTNESVITGTGPFDGVFNDTTDTNGDNLAPLVYAGTRFVSRQDRGLAGLPIIAPFGDAFVQVFNGTTLALTANLQQGQMSVLTPIAPDGDGIIIESNESVIVRWESTGAQDFHVIYPAFTDLWGVPTGNIEIAALENDTNASILTSDGENITVNLSRGESIEISGPFGSEGTSPAARVISNNPIGVYQEADGDGTESAVFIPEFELNTEYILPVPATYIALATTEPGTNCTVTETNGSVVTATSTTQARPFANKILFGGAGDDDINFQVGALITCDALFYAMFEFQNDDSQTGLETNLFGAASSRQLVQPVPSVTQNPQTQFIQRTHGLTDANGIDTVNFDTSGQNVGNYTVVSVGNKTDRFTASGSDEFEIIPGINVSNVSVVKTDSPDPVNTSQNLTYQINVSSTGTGPAFNVTVNDTYPPQVIFLTASPTPLSGTNNTFILGNLTNGTTISVNITVFTTNVSNNTLINNSVNVTFNNETGLLQSVVTTESTTVVVPPAPNFAPEAENVSLTASTINNLTSDNLTVTFDSFDVDGDTTVNFTNFYVDNVSFTTLYLPFEAHGSDENAIAKDYSGFRRNGTVNLSIFNASAGIDGFGAMEFNGINMSLNGITNETINTVAGTIVVWAKPNAFNTTGAQQHIVWVGDPAGNGYGANQELHLGIRHFNESHNLTGFTFWYGDNDNSGGMAQLRPSENWTFVGSGNLTNDRWYHVAVSWDLNVGITRLYLNGTLVAEDNNTNETYDTDAWQDNIHIGRPGAAQRFYNGTMDDLRIYSRALSLAQIEAIYLNRTGVIVSQETVENETWYACVTPNDRTVDGNETCSNNLTITPATPPACPRVFTNSQTLTEDITCPNTAVILDRDNITLDCNGFSIFFGTNGSSDVTGVFADSDRNVTIRNCTIHNTQSSGNGTTVINLSHSNNSKIISNTLIANGTLFVQGVDIHHSSFGQVFNNTILADAADLGIIEGIMLVGGGSTNVTDNTVISHTDFGDHITLVSSGLNLILRNNVTALVSVVSSPTGIRAFSTTLSNNITGNVINVLDATGIDVSTSVAIIANNTINTGVPSSLSMSGISVISANGTQIFGNIINVTSGSLSNGINLLTSQGSVANNRIIVTGVRSNGISPATLSNSILTGNNIQLFGGNNTGIKLVGSGNNNTFSLTNITFQSANGRGIEIINSNDTILDRTRIIDTTASQLNNWMNTSAISLRTNVTNITFEMNNGVINVLPLVQINGSQDVSKARLNVTFNNSFVNSTALTFFNTSSIVTLIAAGSAVSEVSIDAEGDGTFTFCPENICTILSDGGAGGDVIFNVTQWTSYVIRDRTFVNSINLTQTNSILLLNDSLNITANSTSTLLTNSVRANITLPNGSVLTVNLANQTQDIFNFTFLNLTQRGQYNITFIANDTENKLNTTTTTFFFRQSKDLADIRLRLTDLLNDSFVLANYSTTTLSNASNVLNLSVTLNGSRVSTINITAHFEDSFDSILDIDDWQPRTGSSTLYGIDPANLNFTNITVTVNATGQVLRKCANWNASDRNCDGSFVTVQNVEPGQHYTISLNSTDPGFSESSPAVDVALAPVSNETFVLVFIRNDTNVLEFRYLDTDGTLLANSTVDATVDTDSRVSVAPINSTHVAVSWVDGPSDIIRRQIFNVTGTNTTGILDVVSSVGLFTDVSVSQIGDRFGICNANDGNGDAEFRAYNNTNAAEIVSTVQVDSNMRPEATLQNLVECAGVNSTRNVFAWFDDQGANTLVYSILDQNGNLVVDREIIDNTPGDPAQIATTAIDNNKFAILWYDQQEEDITLTVRHIDNTELLAPTDIDLNAGTESRVALTAVRNESSLLDFFVAVWYNQSENAIKAAVFNGTGSAITQPFTVDNSTNSAFRLLDVTAKEPMTNNSICPGHFVVAFSNSTDQGIFRTYNINGSEWDGNCAVGQPDLRLNATSIFFNNTFPRENENISVNVTICNIGTATATAFNVTFKDGNETGGVEISNETITSLPAGSCVVANDTYISVIGNRTICAVADAPLPTGVLTESNESNNVGCTQLHVQQYSFFFGQIDANLTLGDNDADLHYAWNHSDGGKLYYFDADSAFNFSALQALGRNTTNGTAENDFEEATIALNMTVFNESVTLLWGIDNSTPRRVVNMTVSGHLIEGVPIINSTNTSFFVTGILWDTQDDTGDGQFDIADAEDLVFVVNITQDQAGGLGDSIDYEARIPTLLREYKASADVISYITELN